VDNAAGLHVSDAGRDGGISGVVARRGQRVCGAGAFPSLSSPFAAPPMPVLPGA